MEHFVIKATLNTTFFYKKDQYKRSNSRQVFTFICVTEWPWLFSSVSSGGTFWVQHWFGPNFPSRKSKAQSRTEEPCELHQNSETWTHTAVTHHPIRKTRKSKLIFLYRIHEFFNYPTSVVTAQSPALHRASIPIAHIEFTLMGHTWNCTNTAWHLLIDFPLLWYCWALFYCCQQFLNNSCIGEF